MLAADLKWALDPVAFAEEALAFKSDPWQARVLRWPGKRLIMNVSRQLGKSTTAAILGLHTALYYAGSLVLLVSPSLRQSGELFRVVAGFLGRLDVRPKLLEDSKLACQLANGSRIVSLPGTERTVRGFAGADLIIEDEASRVLDDLYYTVRPMLAVSGGRLILMSTPFGKRGHFFEEWENGPPGWERVEVWAKECPRITPEFLAEEREALGDWWYSQEYECQFVETVDQLFLYEHVMGAFTPDVEPLFGDG